MTTAEDARVQRSGSLRFHVLSLIVWRTVMFVHFLFPNICAEGYFQLGDLGTLPHRCRYVKVSESRALISVCEALPSSSLL